MKNRIIRFFFAAMLSIGVLFIFSTGASAALKGDIDADKVLSSADARSVLRASVGLDALTDEQAFIGDIDEDGKISSSDARDILRMSVGLDEIRHHYDKDIIHAPTCTGKGIALRTCTECDDSYEEDIPALGHKYSDPEILTEVTCETDGLEKYTCEICGESETVVVPHGHIWNISKPTCTRDQYCIRGDHIGTPALGHTTDWGKCTRCGIFNTEKYAAQAKIIKDNCAPAVKNGVDAYALISQSEGTAYKLKELSIKAKPLYQKARDSYQAAYDACGSISEFAAIKKELEILIKNTDKILAQIDVISKVTEVDKDNYFTLIGKIDSPQWANEPITSKLLNLITW